MRTSFSILNPIHLAICLFSICAILPISAQIAEPRLLDFASSDPLYELRNKFTSDALQTSRALTEYYLNALANLENDAVAKADYETALEAQERREKLIQLYDLNPIIDPLSITLVLKAHDAKLAGSVTYDRTHASLTGWKSLNHSVTWDVLRILPATYQVTLIYAFDHSDGTAPLVTTRGADGVRLEIGESSALSTGNTAPITQIIPYIQNPEKPRAITVGHLEISRNTAKIYLKIIEDSAAARSFAIKEIRLTPALHPGEPALAGNKDLRPISEFESTQESHGLRLLGIMRPYIEEYKATLNGYLAEVESTNQKALKAQILKELEAAEEYLAKPASRISKEVSSRLSIRAAAKEVLEKCSLVKGKPIQGSLIPIKTSGGEKLVRLQGVTLPAIDQTLEVTAFAQYFTITPQQATEVIRQAQDYMLRHLSSSPFEVCIADQVDEEGNPLASLFIESGQNLATQLVSQGLAGVAATPLESSDIAEKALATALADAESLAKNSTPKKGGWKFQP